MSSISADDVSYDEGAQPPAHQIRTVGDKLREVVSVMDFGAKGDGNTPDDVAIANAIKTAKVVYFPPPPKAYKLTQAVIFTSTCLFGDDAMQCSLEFHGKGPALTDTTEGGPSDTTLVDLPTIRGMTFVNLAQGTIGLDCGYSRRGFFEDLYLDGFPIGVSVGKKSATNGNYFNYFHKIRVAPAAMGRGFVVGSPASAANDGEANANNFINCQVYGGSECGFDLVNANGCTVRASYISSSINPVRIESGSSNFIEAYTDAGSGTPIGLAFEGTLANTIRLYHDGGGYAVFDDHGWNYVTASNQAQGWPPDIVWHQTGVRGDHLIEGRFSYLPAGQRKCINPQPLFRIGLPDGASVIVTVTITRSLEPQQNNYSEASIWSACNVSGRDGIRVMLVSLTHNDSGPVLSTTTEKDTVIWSAPNCSTETVPGRRTTFVATIRIQGSWINLNTLQPQTIPVSMNVDQGANGWGWR